LSSQGSFKNVLPGKKGRRGEGAAIDYLKRGGRKAKLLKEKKGGEDRCRGNRVKGLSRQKMEGGKRKGGYFFTEKGGGSRSLNKRKERKERREARDVGNER